MSNYLATAFMSFILGVLIFTPALLIDTLLEDNEKRLKDNKKGAKEHPGIKGI